MSQKKSKQARAKARSQAPGPADAGLAADAMADVVMANRPMDGLRLGWRAVGMVARRPFAALPMLIGCLAIWVPLVLLLANAVALVMFGDGPGRARGLEFGMMLALWLLVPVLAAASIETAFLMWRQGRVRWRVALAVFSCQTGVAWLIAGSLVLGLAIQAISVSAGNISTDADGATIAVTFAVLILSLAGRAVVFLATARLWSGESGGRQAIGWATLAIPRVVVAWASAMMVLVFSTMLMGAVVLGIAWLVMVAGTVGQGAQLALAVVVLWPVALMAIGAAMAMEARIMLELHALAQGSATKGATRDPGPARKA